MSELLLDMAEVLRPPQQVRRPRVPSAVDREFFRQISIPYGSLPDLLQALSRQWAALANEEGLALARELVHDGRV